MIFVVAGLLVLPPACCRFFYKDIDLFLEPLLRPDSVATTKTARGGARWNGLVEAMGSAGAGPRGGTCAQETGDVTLGPWNFNGAACSQGATNADLSKMRNVSC